MPRWVPRVGEALSTASLQSPSHPLRNRGVLLITLRGCPCGHRMATPAQYLRRGDTLYITSRRSRQCWRYVREPATVRVLPAGRARAGPASALGGEPDRAAARAALSAAVTRRVLERPDLVIAGVDLHA